MTRDEMIILLLVSLKEQDVFDKKKQQKIVQDLFCVVDTYVNVNLGRSITQNQFYVILVHNFKIKSN